MATTLDTNINARPSLLSMVGSTFAAIGKAIVDVAENNPRFRELERLQRLSDEQLAARNLSRDRLVEHVFRGSTWI